MQSFKTIKILPLNLKKVTAELRAMDVGTLEVKRRGIEQIAGDQFMKLKFSGNQPVTVILTRLDRRRIVIVARRGSGYMGKMDSQ